MHGSLNIMLDVLVMCIVYKSTDTLHIFYSHWALLTKQNKWLSLLPNYHDNSAILTGNNFKPVTCKISFCKPMTGHNLLSVLSVLSVKYLKNNLNIKDNVNNSIL